MRAASEAGSKGFLLCAVGLALACMVSAPAQAAPPRTIAEFGAGAGKVSLPNGVAVDQSSGELYVAEDVNHRISKFDAEGDFLLAWGWGVADGTSEEPQACGPAAEPPTKRCFASSSSSSGAGNIRPAAVAVDQSSGDIYVADTGRRRVTKFSPQGDFLFMVGRNVNKTKKEEIGGPYTQEEKNICTSADLEGGNQCGAGESGNGPDEFTTPAALALDASGRVWVGDTDRIASFSPDGSPSPEVALPGAGNTPSFIVDSTGDFFLVRRELNESQTIEFNSFAKGDTFILGNLPALCSATTTASITFDKEGQVRSSNIQAALEAKCGAGSFNVQTAPGSTPASEVIFQGASRGVDESPLSCTKSSSPGSCPITVNRNGRPGRVERLEDGTGTLIEALDEGGFPRAVAVDGDDNIYVGDNTAPYRLIKFNPAGEKVSQFGAGLVSGTPEGNALAVDDSAQVFYTAGSRSAKAESVVQAFEIPSPGPAIDNQRAEDILPTTATLAAALNPEGHATEYRFEYGTSESYGQSTAETTLEESGSPDEGFEQRQVTADLEGLIPDTTYHFRLVATDHSDASCPTTGEECTIEGPDVTFTTRSAVGIEVQWVSEVAARSATLNAELDPLGVAGNWWIEYGTSEALGSETVEAVLPASFGVLSFATVFPGLEPATTYFYRFAASDERDGAPYVVHGAIQSFTTQRGGLGFTLSDSRVWEMVSPSNKHGGEIDTRFEGTGLLQAAASGNALAYLSRGSIEPDPEGNRGLDESSVLARRGASGSWSSKDITLPHTHVTPLSIGKGLEYKLFSTELDKGVLEPRDPTPLSPQATERTPYVRTNTEPADYSPLVTAANALPGFGGEDNDNLGKVSIAGASADLSHVLVKSQVPLMEGAEGNSLYVWSEGVDPGSSLAPVSELPVGEGGKIVAANPGGAEAGDAIKSVFHVVSEDDARAFWTRGGGGSLYVRDLQREETARLDVVQPGGFGAGKADPVFQGANAAGTVAFFTDTRGLTEDASEDGHDLYRCELQASEGELGCKLTDLSGPSARPGESSRVLGMVLGISEDGAQAYFVAEGVLDETPNERGETPVSGEPNLYAWHAGAGVRFIATLSGEDNRNWGAPGSFAFRVTAVASPSGRYLAFTSKLPLTGYDNRDAGSGERAQEVFRYDAQAEELTCSSCNPSGARPEALVPEEGSLARYFDPWKFWSGTAVAALLPEATATSLAGQSLYRSRAVHDNGRVFFNAADSLVPADSNGDGDVYEYEPLGVGSCTASSGGAGVARIEGGCVALISSGGAGGTAAFVDASVGGNDVFFFTPAKLAVTDEDEATDIYDARVDGVAATLPPSAECQGEACQPPATAPVAPTPASAAFSGPGNPPGSGPHPSCSKGKRKVHRKGKARCVKPSHKSQQQHRKHRRRRAAR